MAYVDPNYRTKKEFISAVKAGVKHWPYNPSGMFLATRDGRDTVEGPHYPQPHKWYSAVLVEDGVVVSAK
jgi:hypothetical protein